MSNERFRFSRALPQACRVPGSRMICPFRAANLCGQEGFALLRRFRDAIASTEDNCRMPHRIFVASRRSRDDPLVPRPLSSRFGPIRAVGLADGGLPRPGSQPAFPKITHSTACIKEWLASPLPPAPVPFGLQSASRIPFSRQSCPRVYTGRPPRGWLGFTARQLRRLGSPFRPRE